MYLFHFTEAWNRYNAFLKIAKCKYITESIFRDLKRYPKRTIRFDAMADRLLWLFPIVAIVAQVSDHSMKLHTACAATNLYNQGWTDCQPQFCIFSVFVSMYHSTAQHKLTLTQDFVSVNVTFNTFQCSYIVLLWKMQSEKSDVTCH